MVDKELTRTTAADFMMLSEDVVCLKESEWLESDTDQTKCWGNVLLYSHHSLFCTSPISGVGYRCTRSDPTFLQGADKKTNHKELFHWIEHPVKSLARLGLRKDDQR